MSARGVRDVRADRAADAADHSAGTDHPGGDAALQPAGDDRRPGPGQLGAGVRGAGNCVDGPGPHQRARLPLGSCGKGEQFRDADLHDGCRSGSQRSLAHRHAPHLLEEGPISLCGKTSTPAEKATRSPTTSRPCTASLGRRRCVASSGTEQRPPAGGLCRVLRPRPRFRAEWPSCWHHRGRRRARGGTTSTGSWRLRRLGG